MPGYVTDTAGIQNTLPWGTSVFNGLHVDPTTSDFVDFVDLSTSEDVSGPSDIINPGLPVFSGPNWAGAAADLGGGAGSWTGTLSDATGPPGGGVVSWQGP